MSIVLSGLNAPAGAPVSRDFKTAMQADANINRVWKFDLTDPNTLDQLVTLLPDSTSITQVKSWIDTDTTVPLIPTDAARRPVYETADAAIIPGIASFADFSTQAHNLATTGLDLDGDFFFMMVASFTSDTGTRNVFGGAAMGVNGGSYALQIDYDSGSELVWRVGGGDQPEASVSLPIELNTPVVIFCAFDASAGRVALSLDGISWSTDTAVGATNSQTEFMLGASIVPAGLGPATGTGYTNGGTLYSDFRTALVIQGTAYLPDPTVAATLATLRSMAKRRHNLGAW